MLCIPPPSLPPIRGYLWAQHFGVYLNLCHTQYTKLVRPGGGGDSSRPFPTGGVGKDEATTAQGLQAQVGKPW